MINPNIINFRSIRMWGDITIISFCVLELFLYSFADNLFGCLMTFICWELFKYIGLRLEIILNFLFSWLIFVCLSLYRILPLIATFIEGKPISYKMQNANETFILETILYFIIAITFLVYTKRNNNNNFIQTWLNKMKFYSEVSSKRLWFIGFIGFVFRMIVFYQGLNETGNSVGKFMVAFSFLQFAPFLLFFPNLWTPSGEAFKFKKTPFIYLCFLVLLSVITNSREQMIAPVGTFFILGLISSFKSGKTLFNIYGTKNIIITTIAVFILIPVLSDFSTAMLVNRYIKQSKGTTEELVSKTWETFKNKESLENYKKSIELRTSNDRYEYGWSEDYLDNFALNRFCNIRITDMTLYYANSVGFNNKAMQDDLIDQCLAIIPTPILNFLNIKSDKSAWRSRGDVLYSIASNQYFSSRLVTSDLGDGLVTFGYLFFLIYMILLYVTFIIVDLFLYNKGGAIVYSIFGLILIFNIFGTFRNSNGCYTYFSYILRGAWQDIFISLLMLL